MRLSIYCWLCAMMLTSSNAFAESATNTLDTLFMDIQKERQHQSQLNQQREAAFLDEKNRQSNALEQVRHELTKQQAKLNEIKQKVVRGNTQIEQTQHALNERIHNMRDLFSAWKVVAKDSLVNARNSVLSHQHPEHLQQLESINNLSTLPTVKELTLLNDYLQKDIIQTGKKHTYQGQIRATDGTVLTTSITRTGPFSATADNLFLLYDSGTNSLSISPAQPDFEYIKASADARETRFDPSRGVVLYRLSHTPGMTDRIHQGGYIGYAIITLGLLGLILSFSRWLIIYHSKRQILKQSKRLDQIDPKNPLGKILQAYKTSHAANNIPSEKHTDRLEVRLQEIVLQEMPKLDKGLGALKLLAAIAPLLGLLGTVVGMINTFQTITLVGNADPKLMAAGISQALMTTVLGLIVAVPLLFAHSFVASRAREIMVYLSQQSLAYIAKSIDSSSLPKGPNAS